MPILAIYALIAAAIFGGGYGAFILIHNNHA